MEHEHYMRLALQEAQTAAGIGEVPVGCVIVRGSEVLASAHNLRESSHDASAHAEILAIREACGKLSDWRLCDCRLYVTLEPCPMCAGAIINARVGEVYFGAKDSTMGACGSVLDLFFERFGHRPKVVGGVLKDECAAVMSGFFKGIR